MPAAGPFFNVALFALLPAEALFSHKKESYFCKFCNFSLTSRYLAANMFHWQNQLWFGKGAGDFTMQSF